VLFNIDKRVDESAYEEDDYRSQASPDCRAESELLCRANSEYE